MNTSMKNGCYFLLVLLISAPGCWGRKEKATPVKTVKNSTVNSEINIPMAGDNVKSFFDEDVEEFVLLDSQGIADQKSEDQKLATDDFSWVQETTANGFKTVYFDFDKYGVRDDQQVSVESDIELVKQLLAKGETPTVVIEGHSCHSAGSRTYNLALSEKRAKVLADRLVEAGVARENIKIVARGSDVPAHDKTGKVVTGDRQQQWPNRRDEINVIYS